ncbi:MAG: exonuclease domain-containing protein [Maricaulaceae bacterium]
MTTDKLLIVDLEATCSKDNAISRSDMEIIEIGASVVNLADHAIVDDYQLYIKPVVTPKLTDFCTELTGIKQATVDAAEPYGPAIESYKRWLSGHDDIVAWASWGNYDKGQFETDCRRHGADDPHTGLPHFNLKNLFAKAVGERRMGLGRAVKFVGAKFEGRAHSGRDDAMNMARLLTLSPKFGALMKTKIYDT